VTVAELNPVVVDWCSGPLSGLTDGAVDDPRVVVRIADVASLIARAADGSRPYDAIMLDLYEGTSEANTDPDHPFFGRAALKRTNRALSASGVLAVWTESADPRFVQRLQGVGFTVSSLRPGRGVPRHTVYLARKDQPRRGRPNRSRPRRRS
jgi:spermidine synthase